MKIASQLSFLLSFGNLSQFSGDFPAYFQDEQPAANVLDPTSHGHE
jgi:hypothetical protein